MLDEASGATRFAKLFCWPRMTASSSPLLNTCVHICVSRATVPPFRHEPSLLHRIPGSRGTLLNANAPSLSVSHHGGMGC